MNNYTIVYYLGLAKSSRSETSTPFEQVRYTVGIRCLRARTVRSPPAPEYSLLSPDPPPAPLRSPARASFAIGSPS